FHDVRPGGPDEQVAVLTYGLWQRRFGGRMSVVGATVTVDGQPRTVIGVLPKTFEFPPTIPVGANVSVRAPEIFVPMGIEPSRAVRDNRSYFAFGRRREGVGLAAAQADLSRIARALAREYPEDRDQDVLVADLQRHTSEHIRPALLLVAVAMAVVLLIACVNVANLLLTRGASRSRELALRSALGATRGRVARQLLTESVVLAGLGVGLGLILARWALEGLLAAAPANLDRMTAVRMDGTALLFAAVVGALTAVLVGAYPALALSSSPATGLGGESTRGATAGRGSHTVRRVLVMAEVALSLIMVIAATLLIRSYRAVEQVDGGFDTANTLTFLVMLSDQKYASAPVQRQFYRTAITRLEQIPGVVGAAAINVPPLSGLGNTGTVTPEGAATGPGSAWPDAAFRSVSQSYFSVAGVRLLSGRLFTAGDTAGAPNVIVLGRRLVARLFPDGRPIGRRVSVWGQAREVVGVVHDVREYGFDAEAPFAVFVPVEQEAFDIGGMVVRTKGDPALATDAIRQAVASIDPDLATLSMRSLRETLESSLAQRRFTMRLLATFAAVALLLAAIGLYGVLSHLVSERNREIGIRMALGATEATVVGAIVRDGLKLAGAGVVVGLIGAAASGRLLKGLLFGVTSMDPVTYVAVPLVLLGVAVAATLLPARRAARVDPVEVLRKE
ncbi:MAG: ABC transporter permease, partial [Gemmatimonadota bacterium]